jgi:GMP synthase (glutamine-hydrolysing)
MRRILILKAGETSRAVQRAHGDYDRWFTDSLSRHDLAFDVCDATRPANPRLDGYAGILVTGSVKSVCDAEPWMEGLAILLGRAAEAGVPTLAVCFGCQILARALGGRVIVNPEGWEIGAAEIVLTEAARRDPLFAGLPSPLPVLATHQDRVETLPPGAVLLAGNACTPIQAFRIGERAWGVQFHPEATPWILADLIRLRADGLEEDVRRRGRAAQGHLDGLVAALRGFDPAPAARLMDNFVALCRTMS